MTAQTQTHGLLTTDTLETLENVEVGSSDTMYWLAQVQPSGETYVLEVSSVWQQQPEYELPGGELAREPDACIGWTITAAAGPLHHTDVEAILADHSLGAVTVSNFSGPESAYDNAAWACDQTWTWTRDLQTATA